MSLPSGGHARIDNDWLSSLLPTLPLADSVRLYLRAKAGLRHKGAGLGELMTATGDRDARHTERAVKRLAELGQIICVNGRYYDPAFAPASSPATTPAQTPAPTPANTSFSHQENAVQDDEFPAQKILEGREEEKEEKEDRAVGLQRGAEDPGQPCREHPQTAPPTPPVVISSPVGLAGPANGETARGRGGGERGRGAAPRPEHHGDDHDAVTVFHDLAGYAFVARYRADLARWHRDYSPEFLRLAHTLAQTLPGARGMWTFADVLNRDPRREWPPALQAQYERDVQPVLAAPEVPAARVAVGDLLRWPDGHTATVERVDRADAVTDSPDDARGYVPLSLIGKSVEVLRS